MSNDVRGAFVRQRRSLILVSLVLTVVLVFGIAGSQVRLAPGAGSLTVDFGEATIIVRALWAVWGWFLYRYWQHFLLVRADDLAELLDRQKLPVRSGFSKRMLEMGAKSLEQTLRREHTDFVGIELREPTFSTLPERDGWNHVSASYIARVIITAPGGQPRDLGQKRCELKLAGLRMYPRLIRTILPVNVRHTYFSEYWTAFLFALAPPVAWTYQFGLDAASSFFKILLVYM